MQNYRHTVAAIMAIALIGSLIRVQGEDILNSKRETEQRINAAAAHQSITITQKQVDESVMGVALETNEEEERAVQNKIEESIADKSSYRLGYVKLTSGSLNLRKEPSENAEILGQLAVVDQVEILESTDGYYKVASEKGSGYVSSDCITVDKAQAEEAAMFFEHYRRAKVSVESVNIRKSASTDAEVIKGLASGDEVAVLWGEGDFVRVAYGSDYDEGYVINTAIEFTGEWVKKSDVSSAQQAAAKRKAEAAAAEARARAAAAAGGYNTNESSNDSVTATAAPAASSKGQAIVNSAMQYLGVPYVWGGTSPRGFDCSGLVQYVCRQNGISVNRVAADQRRNGTYVSRENLQPGDLVFFAKGGYIHHVGIYVGNGNMIHAPQTGDVVKISSIQSDYRVKTYAGAVRVY